jgi:hypothetical protein
MQWTGELPLRVEIVLKMLEYQELFLLLCFSALYKREGERNGNTRLHIFQ